MFSKCVHGAEVKQLQQLGHWPEAAGAELPRHVAACAECATQLRLTAAFAEARTRTLKDAPRSAPGLIWWRAQLRRRAEVAERLNRPLLGAQIFALLLAVSAGVFLSSAAFTSVQSCAAWMKSTQQMVAGSFVQLWSSPWGMAIAALMLGVALLLSGALALLAAEKN